MKRVEDVLEHHSEDVEKLKLLQEKREELERALNARRGDIHVKLIKDKVREIDRQIEFVCAALIRGIFSEIFEEDGASMASSSSSTWSEDETSSSEFNGGEPKQTVLGQGGIGTTNIINSNSKIEIRYENVLIQKNYGSSTKKRTGQDAKFG